MVGKKSMGLYGWKQLAMWSIEHACLGDQERKDITRHWEILWREFLVNVIDWYGKRAGETASAVEEKSKM